MVKRLFLYTILFCTFFCTLSLSAQTSKLTIDDQLLQKTIYIDNKIKVMNFSMKDFDALFFEFFQRKLDVNQTLSREEFYIYTVQIAIFSERLIALYPDQKEIAEQTKQKWMSESYEDYLLFKASQKK